MYQTIKASVELLLRITLLMVILSSCNSSSEKSDNPGKKDAPGSSIYIDLSKEVVDVENFCLSAIADSVDYIPLDPSNSFLFSNISNLMVSDSSIFVLDRGGVYYFNSNGKFLKSLYSIGKGPGEAFGSQLTIDNKRNDLYIATLWTKKVLKYSTDGVFIGSYKYDNYLTTIHYFNNNLIFSSSLNPETYSFFIFNMVTNSTIYRHPFRYSHLPVSKGGYSMYYVFFDTYGERILFKEQVCDTIYATSDFSNISAAYILDFGSSSLKPEDFFSNNPYKFDNKKFITAFRDRDAFLLMKGVENNQHHQFLYDKLENNTIISTNMLFANDLDGGPPLYFWDINTSYYDEKILYFYIESNELFDSKHIPIPGSKLAHVKDKVNENSNPILVKAYLKR